MSGDVSIAYQTWGDGPIDIVVVPPIINHLEHLLELDDYVQFMRRLSSFARVIVFDKRGQGMSDYPGANHNTLETRMDDIRAVMDAVNSDKAVIFGCSEGGPISIMFAVSHPQRVSALVLYGTFGKFVRSDEYPKAPFDRHMLEGLFPMVSREWGNGVLAGFLAPGFFSEPEKLEWLAKMERLSNTPVGIKANLDLNCGINVYPLLKVISVPTLILHKLNDTGVSIVTSYDLHKNIAASKFVELTGVNHLPYLDDTALLVGEIEEFLTGKKANKPLPRTEPNVERALATILFTDIVNSTASAVELGDQKWKEILDLHDRVSKEQVEIHRGRYIKSTGDGLLAIFDGPGRAITCAKHIGNQLRDAGIEIRSGLHTGEIELRGQDIGGISVHITSRIESTAGPGEIFVSRTVTELVAGSGIKFTEAGVHKLKGIPGSWKLFAVA